MPLYEDNQPFLPSLDDWTTSDSINLTLTANL